MLRFTLRQLEYFVAVGETGSIARASRKVNVSSPSISAAISQLEAEFGMALFVRQHAQGLSLTQGGRELMEQARVILREAGQLNGLAGEISGSVRGPLAIGGLVTFAQVVLPALRRSFQEAHPDVAARQRELNQVEIFSALRRSEIDVALTYDLDIPTDLSFQPLVDLPPFVLVGAGHPLAGQGNVRIADIASFPMVMLDLPLSADYFLSLFSAEGLRPVIAERTRDMAVMRSLVANGFGYSIANVRPLNRAAPDGKPLEFIALDGDVRAMTMGLLMPKDAEGSILLRAIVDHARAMVERGELPGLAGA